jgi:ribose transport system ATP-binding protein
VLELRNVSTSSGLRDITLTLHAGEILGVYGLMGAGRTELLRSIYGLDRITAGELLLHDKPCVITSAVQATRLGIGLVPEDRVREAMILDATVAANVTLAAPETTGRFGFFAKSKEKKVSQGTVTSVGIKVPSVEAPITALSGGNQQKVVIGRWFVANSSILLLDDPTVGVDIKAKHEIYRLMKELTEQGVSVIVCSSELPEIMHLADRIAIMHRKRIVNTIARNDADPKELIRQSIVGISDAKVPAETQT